MYKIFILHVFVFLSVRHVVSIGTGMDSVNREPVEFITPDRYKVESDQYYRRSI